MNKPPSSTAEPATTPASTAEAALREALQTIAKLDHGRPLIDARTIARTALATAPQEPK